MSSIVGENWEHVDGQDWSENSELSPRNHNILMSLLDETQIDECDDERLTKVIQSLQDELDSADDYCAWTWESSDLVDCQSSIDALYPSMAAVDLDLQWIDVEMMHTSPMIDEGGVNEFSLIKNKSSALPEAEQDLLWHHHFDYE